MQNNNHKFEIREEVREVSRILSDAGFENYLVGGCVRDLLIGLEPKDWDITTSANPEQIITLFPKTFYENEFGTVGVVNEITENESLKVVEVTPYRLESNYSDSRHPDNVKWAKTIQEDLSRRDFTINAIALNLRPTNNDQQLIDPFGGEKDIEKRIIRTVGNPDERFQEDALRLLRALRLASELGFVIEHQTVEAIEKNANLLGHISRERVRDEFVKIVMSDSPSIALEMASRLGILKFISPELEKGIGVEQNKAHVYNVWEHLLRTLDHAAKKKFPLHVRMAALFHDVAKPHTRKWINDQWTFYGHDVVGARLVRETLANLKFSREIIDRVAKLVRWHMFFSDTEEITLSAVRRMVRNVTPELIWDLMNVRASDRIGTGRPKETPYRLRKYKSMVEEAMRDPISAKQLKIDGGRIMKLAGENPGPRIGFILDILLNEVLEDPKLNTEEYLEKRTYELNNLSQHELERQGREARNRNRFEEEKEIEKIREDYKVK